MWVTFISLILIEKKWCLMSKNVTKWYRFTSKLVIGDKYASVSIFSFHNNIILSYYLKSLFLFPFPVKIHFCPIILPPQKRPELSFISIRTIQGNPWGVTFEPIKILKKIDLYLWLILTWSLNLTISGIQNESGLKEKDFLDSISKLRNAIWLSFRQFKSLLILKRMDSKTT